MRIAILILVCCIALDAFGQFHRSKDLFQVILADKVVRSGGKSIKGMDFLQKGDTLVVSSGGTLAMLHKSMYPVEISIDSVVVIEELSEAIDSYTKLNTRPYKQLMLKELNVSRLFAITPEDVRPERLRPIGAVHRGWYPRGCELFYPPIEGDKLDMSNALCLTWRPNKDLVRIEVTDLMEDVIVSFPVSTNSLTISKEDLMKIKEKVALLSMVDSLGHHLNNFVLRKFYPTLPFPYPCNLDKPSFALLVALGMEFANPPYLEGAEEYFVLATKLSPHPFYTQMLSNYRERRKLNWKR